MDAQYPFASREDIWRVQEEVKELYATQAEHHDRISRLERRRDDDARMKNVWAPLSPFPGGISTAHHQESSFNPTAEPFKGFDQTHQHGLTSTLQLESEEEPRRGASRANSVRFDESSMYYSQGNRSTTELLPLRTGSGLGSHPLTERSLSHRSDGKQSSSGQSHHSARTNSLGLETSRMLGGGGTGLSATTPLPPPGLFILGPVPCIIRCWLTTNFSNDSLLYAAVCTGSYRSVIGEKMVRKLGLETETTEEDGVRIIKLPVYLPEASVYQPSSRGGSPVPQLPALTVRFIVRTSDPNDNAIQIFLGSDVLRAHNADILFSQDKMLIVDDERNKISIPLVRPEDASTFKSLYTGPQPVAAAARYNGTVGEKENGRLQVNGDQATEPSVEGHGSVTSPDKTDTSALTIRTSSDSFESQGKPHSSLSARFPDDHPDNSPDQVNPKSSTSDQSFAATSKTEGSGVWGPWRRESSKAETSSPFMSAYQRSTRARNMKVLKPTKPTISSSRQVSSTTPTPTAMTASSGFGDFPLPRSSAEPHDTSNRPSSSNNAGSVKSSSDGGSAGGGGPKSRTANPVGGASAFGWLNAAQRKQNAAGSE
ncbi:hypothetical protein FQN53_008888 [Emmonsiellopsis sp. PD_33]|nr:hypothetical protein FQN53_008888 [Emmonsiellopsis sp. PD_33]